MSKSTLLITGGNTGLGFEIVKALCQSDIAYTIYLGSRSIEKAEEAIKKIRSEVPDTRSEVSPLQIDIADDYSIEKAVSAFSSKHDHLDILINNAGASFDSQIDPKDLSSIRKAWNNSWDVNVAGTHVMTYAFVPLLLKSSSPRVVFITSGASSLAQTGDTSSSITSRLNAAPPAGWPKEQHFPTASYRSAKTGMNMMMREWAKALRHDNVKILTVSPGFLATNLGGMGPEAMKKMGAAEPEVGGKFVRDVVEGKRDEEAGKVSRWFGGSDVQPW